MRSSGGPVPLSTGQLDALIKLIEKPPFKAGDSEMSTDGNILEYLDSMFLVPLVADNVTAPIDKVIEPESYIEKDVNIYTSE